jgi:hypothetical protein
VPEQDRIEVRKKLTAAWQATVKRLLDAGYEPSDVFETMAAVGLDRSMPDESQQRCSPLPEVVLDRSTTATPPGWFRRT